MPQARSQNPRPRKSGLPDGNSSASSVVIDLQEPNIKLSSETYALIGRASRDVVVVHASILLLRPGSTSASIEDKAHELADEDELEHRLRFVDLPAEPSNSLSSFDLSFGDDTESSKVKRFYIASGKQLLATGFDVPNGVANWIAEKSAGIRLRRLDVRVTEHGRLLLGTKVVKLVALNVVAIRFSEGLLHWAVIESKATVVASDTVLEECVKSAMALTDLDSPFSVPDCIRIAVANRYIDNGFDVCGGVYGWLYDLLNPATAAMQTGTRTQRVPSMGSSTSALALPADFEAAKSLRDSNTPQGRKAANVKKAASSFNAMGAHSDSGPSTWPSRSSAATSRDPTVHYDGNSMPSSLVARLKQDSIERLKRARRIKYAKLQGQPIESHDNEDGESMDSESDDCASKTSLEGGDVDDDDSDEDDDDDPWPSGLCHRITRPPAPSGQDDAAHTSELRTPDVTGSGIAPFTRLTLAVTPSPLSTRSSRAVEKLAPLNSSPLSTPPFSDVNEGFEDPSVAIEDGRFSMLHRGSTGGSGAGTLADATADAEISCRPRSEPLFLPSPEPVDHITAQHDGAGRSERSNSNSDVEYEDDFWSGSSMYHDESPEPAAGPPSTMAGDTLASAGSSGTTAAGGGSADVFKRESTPGAETLPRRVRDLDRSPSMLDESEPMRRATRSLCPSAGEPPMFLEGSSHDAAVSEHRIMESVSSQTEPTSGYIQRAQPSAGDRAMTYSTTQVPARSAADTGSRPALALLPSALPLTARFGTPHLLVSPRAPPAFSRPPFRSHPTVPRSPACQARPADSSPLCRQRDVADAGNESLGFEMLQTPPRVCTPDIAPRGRRSPSLELLPTPPRISARDTRVPSPLPRWMRGTRRRWTPPVTPPVTPPQPVKKQKRLQKQEGSAEKALHFKKKEESPKEEAKEKSIKRDASSLYDDVIIKVEELTPKLPSPGSDMDVSPLPPSARRPLVDASAALNANGGSSSGSLSAHAGATVQARLSADEEPRRREGAYWLLYEAMQNRDFC